MPTEPQLKFHDMPVVCFAPALSDDKLAVYDSLISGIDGELYDALSKLMKCVKYWWSLPESKTHQDHPRLAIKHRGEDITVPLTPLESSYIASLDSVTPYLRELTIYSNERNDGLFDSLPPGELRDAAFHLLWYVKEIANDREPLSQDKLST